MKPFLLVATRAEEEAATDEYAAMCRFSGLAPDELRRHRLERDPLQDLDLDDWSGLILGGGPFTVSDADPSKSAAQRRAEADITALLDRVVASDFPFLGACYGIGTLGLHEGAVVDRTYGEPIGRVPVTLTAAGRDDPIFDGCPQEFEAFVGHKEAVSSLPAHATLLASSPNCPVQAFRVGRNVYATQFHPELDSAGLVTRIEVYRAYGYFEEHEMRHLQAAAREREVEYPPLVLRNFVARYQRP